MAKIIIGVFGAGRIDQDGEEWQTAKEIGRGIALGGAVLLTGGLGGVMSAACQGAKEAGGLTVGILPGDRYGSFPNPFVDIAIFSGMGEARNVINVKSCDAAIAVGGEFGTLSEIALSLKCGCPLVLYNSWSFTAHNGRSAGPWQTARDAPDAVRLAFAAIKRG